MSLTQIMTNGRITGDFSSEEEQVMERVKRRLAGILVSQMRLGGERLCYSWKYTSLINRHWLVSLQWSHLHFVTAQLQPMPLCKRR